MFRKKVVLFLALIAVLMFAPDGFAQGRKMGLFVGINEYQDGISRLRSCVNDAVNMQNRLVKNYGFSKSNTTLLTDAQATRQRILAELENYEKLVSGGDLFVFYYSGHGAVFPDAESDNPDETEQFGMQGYFPSGFYDSTLVPVDARKNTSGKRWKNMILDDELNEIFSRFTAKGVQVIFISDSCHSGTLGKNLSASQRQFKFVSPKTLGFNLEDWKTVANRKGRKSNENFNKLLLVVGSSQDNQFSEAGGSAEMSLFTKVFIAKLDEFATAKKVFTYKSIKDEVNPAVDSMSGGDQTPRLDERFFTSGLLDKPIFFLQQNELKIVVKVTDETGKPITDAFFGIFTRGAKIDKGEGRKTDALMLGITDDKGLFDSRSQNLKYGSRTLPGGIYQIKVVKQGYKAFIREMNVVESKNGIAVFSFKLVRE